MALFSQRPAEEMSSSTRFHANQLNVHVRCETKQLDPRELLPHDNPAGLVETYQVKDCLAKIDADGLQVHGTPPRSPLYPAMG
jgi:hypothetical protein